MEFLAFVRDMPMLEALGVVFSVLYLVLAIRESLWCWPAALIASLLSVIVLYEARLLSESALNVFYAAMAVYGWYQWRFGRRPREQGSGTLQIATWPWRTHAATVAACVLGGGFVGLVMSRYTSAAFPYLDAFVTVSSVVTTYMVARKILENWIYWIVIDSLSLYVYVARGLYGYAALFALYLVLAVLGWYRWRRDWLAQSPALA